MNADLQGKRVVFICVKSFNFEGFIVNGLLKMGAEVRYFDERPSNTWLEKAVIRFKKQVVANRIDAYYKSVLEQLRGFNPDYLLVIRSEVVPQFFLEEFKTIWPEAKKIFYHADSFLNNPEPLKILNYFDLTLTFDPKDAQQYRLKYLPLYYHDFYLNNRRPFKDRQYDISFIGTLHSDRTEFVQKILDQFPKEKRYVFYFNHGLLALVYFIISTKTFPFKSFKYIRFRPLLPSKTREVFLNSKVIIDVEHPYQSGLTSRTMEALGAQCKLITTNEQIIHHDFYNASNILVVDRKNPIVSKEFLKIPNRKLDDDIVKKYTLTNWLKRIFEEVI